MEIIIGAIGLVLLFAVGMVIGYKLDDDSDTFGYLLKAVFLVMAVCMAVLGMVGAGKAEAERNFLLEKYEIRYEKTYDKNDSIIKIDSSYVLKSEKE